MQDAHRVRAWESAVRVAVKTRTVVARFPRREYAELKGQMITSAESIAHNIAEGRAASSPVEFLRFLDIAARSASELIAQVDVGAKYGIIPQRTAFDLNGSAICTRRMIRALQTSIRAAPDASR